jgi:hypothetical protein
MKEINVDTNLDYKSLCTLHTELENKKAEEGDLLKKEGRLFAIVSNVAKHSVSIVTLDGSKLLNTTSDWAGVEQQYLSDSSNNYQKYKLILEENKK